MLIKLNSGVLFSLDPHLIEVEVEHKNGFPGFDIVGLPDASIKESKERVMQSIRHSGYDIQFRRVLCNLAPAHLKKNGTYLDIAIAMGIMASSGIINPSLFKDVFMIGELGFQGQLRPIQGALTLALLAKKEGFKSFIFPYENKEEVSVIDGMDFYPVKNLKEAEKALLGKKAPEQFESFNFKTTPFIEDFSDVKGQAMAKRALEIAAAGFHNILLMGSPGVGKSMLAKRLITIMPPISLEDAIDITQIYSAAPNKSGFHKGLITQRPFRSPHHSSSDVSIAGGGSIPKPGEISLAHHGVLFLDEFPEFKRTVFEVLREPLEDHTITVSRSEKVQQFPAHFLLMAAMNPCPCGYYLHPTKECHCSSDKISRYYHKISGPILDRIDLHVQMAESQFSDVKLKEESSKTIQERVINAQRIQQNRFKDNRFNSQMTEKEMYEFCQLDPKSESLLKEAMEKLSFSMRGYTKIVKLSRTIADLEGSQSIQMQNVLEAIQYRNIEKKFS